MSNDTTPSLHYCDPYGTNPTRNNTVLCYCYPGYYGDVCDQIRSYWPALPIAVLVIFLTCYTLILATAIVSVIAVTRVQIRKQKKAITISTFSHAFLIIGCLFRIPAFFVTETARTFLPRAAADPSPYLSLIFNTCAVASFISASSLIIGLWFALSISRIKLRLAKAIKIVCIVSAAVVLALNLSGFALLAVTRTTGPGVIALIVLPLILIDITYTVVSSILVYYWRQYVTGSMHNHAGKAITVKSSLADRQASAVKRILPLTLFWFVGTIFGAYGGYTGTNASAATTGVFVLWVYQLCEIGVCIVVLLLLTRNRTPRQLFLEISGQIVTSGTTTTSSKTSTSSQKNSGSLTDTSTPSASLGNKSASKSTSMSPSTTSDPENDSNDAK